jgi:hypothetical protein
MSVYMRAVMSDWHEPSLEELDTFVQDRSGFRVTSPSGRGWEEFEAVDGTGRTVLAGDLWLGEAAREELEELEEFLEDLDGSAAARRTVGEHMANASAVVGMQILMSAYDEAVAAANVVIDFLEQGPRLLIQADTVGWYDGPEHP